MSRDKGNSFLRIFNILEYLSQTDTPQNAVTISEETDIPQPSVYRLCQMLVEEDLIVRHMDGNRYYLGPRMFSLAGNVITGTSIGMERRAILTSLVNAVGETCNFVIPEKTCMTYADRVEASWPIQIQLRPGTVVPLHCTAAGKLYLSTLESRKRKSIISKVELKGHTEKSITTAEELDQELRAIRKQGYSLDRGEFLDGIVAIAAPVHAANGKFCGCIAIHAPETRMSMDKAISHLPRLQEATQEMEKLLT
ncbi:IclR family transcriptional regulator [Kiloniella sp. b19]|uniref:IclR family transcriptional regulator n=1 Tax=Kiloniella sp. GXU_MW_B19 TaxID=3141326 RepID=UPI0031DA070E